MQFRSSVDVFFPSVPCVDTLDSSSIFVEHTHPIMQHAIAPVNLPPDSPNRHENHESLPQTPSIPSLDSNDQCPRQTSLRIPHLSNTCPIRQPTTTPIPAAHSTHIDIATSGDQTSASMCEKILQCPNDDDIFPMPLYQTIFSPPNSLQDKEVACHHESESIATPTALYHACPSATNTPCPPALSSTIRGCVTTLHFRRHVPQN